MIYRYIIAPLVLRTLTVVGWFTASGEPGPGYPVR